MEKGEGASKEVEFQFKSISKHDTTLVNNSDNKSWTLELLHQGVPTSLPTASFTLAERKLVNTFKMESCEVDRQLDRVKSHLNGWFVKSWKIARAYLLPPYSVCNPFRPVSCPNFTSTCTATPRWTKRPAAFEFYRRFNCTHAHWSIAAEHASFLLKYNHATCVHQLHVWPFMVPWNHLISIVLYSRQPLFDLHLSRERFGVCLSY